MTATPESSPPPLRPGMVLDRPVMHRGRTMFAAGRVLSAADIARLKQLGIRASASPPTSSATAADSSDPPLQTDPLSPSLRRQAVNVVKRFHETFEQFDREQAGEIHTLAARLVEEVSRASRLGIAVHDLRSHSDYTFHHSVNVSAIALAVGKQMGVDRAGMIDLAVGGLLHDIGKMKITRAILEKEGPLSARELRTMREHPTRGWELLMEMNEFSPVVAAIARQHHETLDGRGYPDNLREARIHPLARLVTVVDLWDALRSDRPYKAAWAPDQILDHLDSPAMAGKLDRDVLAALRELIVPYPVGSRVMITGGRTAIVDQLEPDNLARPVLRLEKTGERLALRERPAVNVLQTLQVAGVTG